MWMRRPNRRLRIGIIGWIGDTSFRRNKLANLLSISSSPMWA